MQTQHLETSNKYTQFNPTTDERIYLKLFIYLEENNFWICGKSSCHKISSKNSKCGKCNVTYLNAINNNLAFSFGNFPPKFRNITTTDLAKMALQTVNSEVDVNIPISPNIFTGHRFNPIQNDHISAFDLIRTRKVKIVKFIPKKSRQAVVDLFHNIVTKIKVDPSNLTNWAIFQAFPKLFLAVPKEMDKINTKKSSERTKIQNSSILDRIQKWNSSERDKSSIWEETFLKPIEGSSAKPSSGISDERMLMESNIRRANTFIENGRLSDAISTLESNGVASDSHRVLDELREKHPYADKPTFPIGPLPAALQIEDLDELRKMMRSFPRGSAAGRDGFSSQFFEDLLDCNLPEKSLMFLKAEQTLVNIFLAGKAPDVISEFVSSAPLIPLNKPDGSIRPIAVGEVHRRLVSKVAAAFAKKKYTTAYLEPLQVGVGTRCGAEALVHSINRNLRLYGERDDHVCLLIDFKNAFNSVNRDSIMSEIRLICPEIATWVEYSYQSAPRLYTNTEVLFSCKGVQQGDPLGPLLFALALHPIVTKIASECTLDINGWYLDDGSLIGKTSEVLKALKILQSESASVGLDLNLSKCELFWPTPNPTLWNDFPQEIGRNETLGAHILGSPIGDPIKSQQYVAKRVVKIVKAIENVKKLNDPQKMLLLLRSCLSLPKFMFVLRSSPPENLLPCVKELDEATGSFLNLIFGADLKEKHLTRIGLAIDNSGFGIPLAKHRSHCAFLASNVQSLGLQARIQGVQQDILYPNIDNLLADFYRAKQIPIDAQANLETILSAAKPQKLLTSMVEAVMLSEIQTLDNIANPRELALIQACQMEGSGTWLKCLPYRSLNLCMAPAQYRVALKYRLGIELFKNSFTCPMDKCTSTSDIHGDHLVSCKFGGNAVVRHETVKARIIQACNYVGINVDRNKEILDLCQDGTNDRPADVYIRDWGNLGQPLAVDVSIVAFKPLKSVKDMETKKIKKYEERLRPLNIHFTPFVCNSVGCFGASTKPLLNKIATLYAAKTGSTFSSAVHTLMQQISFGAQYQQANNIILATSTAEFHREDLMVNYSYGLDL